MLQHDETSLGFVPLEYSRTLGVRLRMSGGTSCPACWACPGLSSYGSAGGGAGNTDETKNHGLV